MDGGGNNVQQKVMLVADPTRESAGALQYALSHVLDANDTLILFHVENPSAWKNRLGRFFQKQPNPNGIINANNNNSGGPPPPAAPTTLAEMLANGGNTTTTTTTTTGSALDVDFLDAMKQACAVASPKLNVVIEKIEMAEGQDKASIILAQSWVLKIDLIIIGQRKKLTNAILGQKRGVDTAEYLILNSKCGCVAVQKKGQNAGYILTSKTQKNFWLLA